MNVAINARFTGYGYAEGYARYTKGLLREMAALFPEDGFFMLYDRTDPHPFISLPNMHWAGAGPAARHPLLWKYWYDVKLGSMAKKAGADIIFSPDGFCSLRTRIPQVLAIHDLAFLHFPEGIPSLHRRYYTYFTPRFIRRARHIVTVSDHARRDILRHYPFAEGKISVVYNAADEGFRPLGDGEKEGAKLKYAGGKEFFLYVGSIHPRKNLINLLKGFSWFKKRHQSHMKLVLAGRMAWKNEGFRSQLENYKYRDDVILTGYLAEEELQRLTGAAYAMVYPSFYEGFGLPVLEAMQSGVPVIASGNSAIPEIAGDAAFYADPAQPEEWGKGMGLVYKDETYRAKLIENGLARAARFSWSESARLLHGILRVSAASHG